MDLSDAAYSLSITLRTWSLVVVVVHRQEYRSSRLRITAQIPSLRRLRLLMTPQPFLMRTATAAMVGRTILHSAILHRHPQKHLEIQHISLMTLNLLTPRLLLLRLSPGQVRQIPHKPIPIHRHQQQLNLRARNVDATTLVQTYSKRDTAKLVSTNINNYKLEPIQNINS